MAKKSNGVIKIEKGIPMPATSGGKPRKYPWDAIEVGESFLFEPHVKESGVRAATAYGSRVSGKKFSVRKTSEGYRCWRAA